MSFIISIIALLVIINANAQSPYKEMGGQLVPHKYTTTQRDALTAREYGIISNTTTSNIEAYISGAWYQMLTGATSIGDMIDVSVSGVADGDLLSYNSASGAWYPIGTGDLTFTDITASGSITATGNISSGGEISAATADIGTSIVVGDTAATDVLDVVVADSTLGGIVVRSEGASDAYIKLGQSTTTSGAYGPSITTRAEGSGRSTVWGSVIELAADSGGNPIVQYASSLSTYNQPSIRDLFVWGTYSSSVFVPLMTMEADGDLEVATSISSPLVYFPNMSGDVEVSGSITATNFIGDIANLNPEKYVTVSPSGADYTTIQAALDANATANLLVFVYPGTYTNDTINFTANNQTVAGATPCPFNGAEIVSTAQIVDYGAFTGGRIVELGLTGNYTSAIDMVTGSGSLTLFRSVLEVNASGTIAGNAAVIAGTGTVITKLGKIILNNTASSAGQIKTAISLGVGSTVTSRRTVYEITNSGSSAATVTALSVSTGILNLYNCDLTIVDNDTPITVGFANITGSGEHEYYYNDMHVTNNNGTAYGILLSSATSVENRSMFNHIHVESSGGTSVFANLGANTTLISQFDDVVADTDNIGVGTYTRVNSPSDGSLSLTGDINVSGSITVGGPVQSSGSMTATDFIGAGPNITGLTLNQMDDVTIAGVADEEGLVYDSASALWKNGTLSATVDTLNAIGDVTITSASGTYAESIVWSASDTAYINKDLHLRAMRFDLILSSENPGTTGIATTEAGGYETIDIVRLHGDVFGTLASNQITLPAGEYIFNVPLMLYSVSFGYGAIADITNSTVIGRSFTYTNSGDVYTASHLVGHIIIAGDTVFEIQVDSSDPGNVYNSSGIIYKVR